MDCSQVRETVSAARADVVAAFEASDVAAIRRLGWWDVWEAAATWWAPRQSCTAPQFVFYAKLLGEENPAAVLDAFRDLCGDWRPTPAQVRARLHRPAEEKRVRLDRSRDVAKGPEAIAAVDKAFKAGESECTCDFHMPTWNIDRHLVLRCRTCNGLEAGQIYEVADSRPDSMLLEAVT